MNNLSIKKVPKAKTSDFKALTLPLIKVGAFDKGDVYVFSWSQWTWFQNKPLKAL